MVPAPACSRLRAGDVRHMDDAAARLRHDELADVLIPAVYYASQGHPLVERANATIRTVEELFRKYWPTSAAVYLPGGKRRRPARCSPTRRWPRLIPACCGGESAGGDRVKQIEKARLTWGEGFVAEAIDRFCARRR